MNYLLVPDLIAILWMAIVLSHLRTRHASDILNLWIIGLGLVVVEGVARILYLAPLSPFLHRMMQVCALDAYFLAGVAFFQSAIGKLRFLRFSIAYLVASALPSFALISAYGAGMSGRPLFLSLALLGLLTGLCASVVFRRPPAYLLCQMVIWLPVLEAVWAGETRAACYLLLFSIYAATSIAFCFTLPRERRGRGLVISGFALWSLCFVSHPWLATYQPQWILLADKIWDLQKFIVTFGLLIVSLEEDSAAKEYQALHDTLTGLPNRRLFRDRLEQAMAQADRKGARLVLFNIDLDGLKGVNDRWGHDAGDALLREASDRLQAVTRHADTLARMGGDEFNLLIQEFAPEIERFTDLPSLLAGCSRMTESFRHAVEKSTLTLEAGGLWHSVQPRLSIGCALYPDQAATLEELCSLADAMMYKDKRRRALVSKEGHEFAEGELLLATGRGSS